MITGIISFYLSSLIAYMTPMKTEIARDATAPYADILQVSPLPAIKTVADTATGNPDRTVAIAPPNVKAAAYLIIDLASGKTLVTKNERERRPIGSITKLMTALIVLEENNLNDVITVPEEATKIDGSRIWLVPNEKLSARDVLEGMLINSGNDAAYTLALYNAGSVDTFVAKMNAKAARLGLTDTHFGNPAGFDRGDNYSSAHDIAQLAIYAYRNAFIRATVRTAKKEITSLSGKFKHQLENTNILLTQDKRFRGIKTGHTLEAGYSFVGLAELKNNAQVITVVLDSPSRFQESRELANWAEQNVTW